MNKKWNSGITGNWGISPGTVINTTKPNPSIYTYTTGGTPTMKPKTEIPPMKATLTQEQSEALQFARCKHHDDSIIYLHVRDHRSGWEDGAEALNGMNLDVLARALYVGWNVEKQHPLKDYYDRCELYTGTEDWRSGVRHGIAIALKKLDIKIKGINE